MKNGPSRLAIGCRTRKMFHIEELQHRREGGQDQDKTGRELEDAPRHLSEDSRTG